MKQIAPFTLVLAAVVSLVIAGCNSPSTDSTSGNNPPPQPTQATQDDEPSQPSQDDANPASGDQTAQPEGSGTSSAMEKMKEGLSELSDEDRASAEKQHVCPVSGEMLGTMGKPYKVEVEGQQVWLCCPGCESKLRKNPKEYLAKLTSTAPEAE